MAAKFAPIATISEVAVAKHLPSAAELRTLLSQIRYLQATGLQSYDNVRLIPGALSGARIDEICCQMGDLLRTPIGVDMLAIILPLLIDACERGAIEAERQHLPADLPE